DWLAPLPFSTAAEETCGPTRSNRCAGEAGAPSSASADRPIEGRFIGRVLLHTTGSETRDDGHPTPARWPTLALSRPSPASPELRGPGPRRSCAPARPKTSPCGAGGL